MRNFSRRYTSNLRGLSKQLYYDIVFIIVGSKRKFSEVESSYPSPPAAGDDSVFYDSDETIGETNGGQIYQQSVDQDKQRNVSRASVDEPTDEQLESPGNHIPSYRARLHPLDLLTRLFPTQKRSVLELILKGYHGDVFRVIECVLPSHEKAMVSLKSPESPVLHYNPVMHPGFNARQTRPPYQGPMRSGHYPLYGSAPGFSYPMVEYLHQQNCSLRPNCAASEKEHAYNVVPGTEQTNIVGKVCSECSTKCSPTSNFCSSCGKCFKET